jgi:CRP-like cAMP-binding protein
VKQPVIAFLNKAHFCNKVKKEAALPILNKQLKHFQKGESIINQEEKFDGDYCIIKGSAKIVRRGSHSIYFVL